MLRSVENEPADLIDVKDAAAVLNVKPASVYRAIKDGRIEGYRRDFDGKLAVRRSEVQRLARFRPMRQARRDDAIGA